MATDEIIRDNCKLNQLGNQPDLNRGGLARRPEGKSTRASQGLKTRLLIVVVISLFVGGPRTSAGGGGRIEGTVTRVESTLGMKGVTVVLSELGLTRVTDTNGTFNFESVPAGNYVLHFSLGDDSDSQRGIEVEPGGTTSISKSLDWDTLFQEAITVVSASRRREKLTEAPAAVTSIGEEQIQREKTHGLLPKLFEFTPGVGVTQGGVFDFNLNVRGFNSSLNRRILVLIDGRDPSIPLLGAQEWGIVSQYMSDLVSAELVRGPSSALYGANAFNGVLNLVTRGAKVSRGGEIQLTAGELDTRKAEMRWATSLGHEWYLKLSGSHLKGDDFSVDRDVTVEYSGLQLESIPRPVDVNEVAFGNIRLEKHLKQGDFFTVEGGWGDTKTPALQSGAGRFAIANTRRQWGRVNYTSNHWNIQGSVNSREADEQVALQAGIGTHADSENFRFEFQTHWDFADDRVRLVAGATYGEERFSSANPQGVETLLFEPMKTDSQAVFGQLDFDLGDHLKLVLAGRHDKSSRHTSQISPKASLVYNPHPNHTLRFTYNEAFQVANHIELFLQLQLAELPSGLLENLVCTPMGVSCGLEGVVPVMAVGNKNLAVEEITGLELGYTGTLGGKAFLTFDVYNNDLVNFITDLQPQQGTSLGLINPDFGAYQGSGVPQDVLDALVFLVNSQIVPGGILSNNLDGSPIVAAASYANFGKVTTRGVDLGLQVYLAPRWSLNASYSWFDFDINSELPGDPLLPNAPKNRYTLGLSHVATTYDMAISYRHVDGFSWASGTLYRGPVPAYDTVDLSINYRFDDHWKIGVHVANLFDEVHYESFGGALIGRLALASAAYQW